MNTFTINLLPPEFAREEKLKQKFRRVQLISIAVVLFLIFISTATAGLRFLQIQEVRSVEARVKDSEGKVLSLKDKEIGLAVLKNKLSSIKEISKDSSEQARLFEQLNSVLPKDIRITSFTISDKQAISISGVSPSAAILEDFFSSALASSDGGKDGFNKITLETLSRGREGVYRFSLQLMID